MHRFVSVDADGCSLETHVPSIVEMGAHWKFMFPALWTLEIHVPSIVDIMFPGVCSDSSSSERSVAISSQGSACAVTVCLRMTKRKLAAAHRSGASQSVAPGAKKSRASSSGAAHPSAAGAEQSRASSQDVEVNNSGATQSAGAGTQNDSRGVGQIREDQ